MFKGTSFDFLLEKYQTVTFKHLYRIRIEFSQTQNGNPVSYCGAEGFFSLPLSGLAGHIGTLYYYFLFRRFFGIIIITQEDFF